MNIASVMSFLNTVSTPSFEGSNADDFNNAMTKLKGIVQLILNVIYVVLALFLMVKGAILGMQIVKAADEPQVRQEKIGSLKWLVIGIAIAYGVAGLTNIVVKVISTNLKM